MGLKENLENEANKKSLTGEKRRHYIGGTIGKIKKEQSVSKPSAAKKTTPVKKPGEKKPQYVTGTRKPKQKKVDPDKETVTVMSHTDAQIQEMKAEVAKLKKRIPELQELHRHATPNSFQYFNTADKILETNTKIERLEAKVRLTTQTSAYRARTHYVGHRKV